MKHLIYPFYCLSTISLYLSQGQIKYVMLNPSSKLKGEKDMMKYEKARQLKAKIGEIRSNYMDVSLGVYHRRQLKSKIIITHFI